MSWTGLHASIESRQSRAVGLRPWLVQLALVLFALGGCASVDPYSVPPMAVHLERDDAVGYCARLFADIDRRVDVLGVRDAESPRVAGFPYLRVDRFSAALADRTGSEAQQQAWRTRLQQLDETGRATELANASLSIDDLARCRALLAAADASALGDLRSAAKVPDNYSIAMRTVGVYPLTRIPFAAGISKWQADTRSVFATPLAALPVRGQLQRYAPAMRTSEETGASIEKRDALGVPVLLPADLTALLIRHAPVLEVDIAGAYDELGALALDAEDRVTLDTARPVAYTRVTYMVIGGLIYPQLVYTFWFGERPSSGQFDPLAGQLDGVVWRVTLDRAGDALVYDSMHPCGCYHLFFPTEKVVARPLPETLDESLFVPQSVRGAGMTAITLRIESGTHYLQRVQSAPPTPPLPAAVPAMTKTIAYTMQDERTLTTLARRMGGTRSAYGPDGMVAGSERGERWFFWPMGIASAGQMRQWGHHATAFVGRRHFDDPLLFDTYFEIPTSKGLMQTTSSEQQLLRQP